MNLSELIDTHRGGRSYAELARDCGGSPTDKRLQQLVRQEIRNFPDPPTMRALAKGLRVPESAVVLAAAESLGIDARLGISRLAELLPVDTDRLTEVQAGAIAHLVRAIVDDPRLSDDPPAADLEGIEPKSDRVMQAQAKARGLTVEELLGERPVQSGPRHGLEDLDDPALTRAQRIQILTRVGLTESEAEAVLDARVGDPTYEWARKMRLVIARVVGAEEDLMLAARRDRSRGRQVRAEQDMAGEESQDVDWESKASPEIRRMADELRASSEGGQVDAEVEGRDPARDG